MSKRNDKNVRFFNNRKNQINFKIKRICIETLETIFNIAKDINMTRILKHLYEEFGKDKITKCFSLYDSL